MKAALSRNHATLPVYLAGPETCRRFGPGPADPPLHLVSNAEGRIAAIARGGGEGTIHRLEAQVQGWLEELDPLGEYAVRHDPHKKRCGRAGPAIVLERGQALAPADLGECTRARSGRGAA